MLNLKELEDKLDKALANETEQSLSEWLFSKRLKGLEFLGEGKFEYLSNSHYTIHSDRCVPQNKFEHTDDNIIVGESEYALAA